MKIGNKLKSANTATPKKMPASELEKMLDMSINDCIEKGLITELGDDRGRFIFAHADADIDACYAIVNGQLVQVSKPLAATPAEEVNNIIGDLKFTKGLSQEKWKDGKQDENGEYIQWYRLSLPGGIRLGDATYSLEAKAVESK